MVSKLASPLKEDTQLSVSSSTTFKALWRIKRRKTTKAVSLPKCPTGIQGLGRNHRRRFAARKAHAGLRQRRLRKNAAGHGVPGPRRHAVRRAGRLHGLRGDRRELTQNVRSLGFDLDDLVRQKKMALDYVRIERSEIEETGEYDLEGLFIRLGCAIDSIGAKRVVLDTIESLFSGLSNTAILRAELRRLFRWLKQKGVTAIITGERGDGT